jgi:chromosome segregation ATPase
VGEGRAQTSRQRVTVAQAAEILGVTVEAIRGRIKRGTLEHERHSGTVYVLLDADQSTNRTRPDIDQTADRLQSDGTALISEMRAHNATLQAQLEAERQAHAEARRLLMAALERIPPQLEAPSEPQEADVSPDPTSGPGEVWGEIDAERARREMAETTLHEGMDEERRRREDAERERDYLRRELHALRAPRESPETVEEEPERAEPHSATVGAQEGVQRRPWWRRVLGG